MHRTIKMTSATDGDESLDFEADKAAKDRKDSKVRNMRGDNAKKEVPIERIFRQVVGRSMYCSPLI